MNLEECIFLEIMIVTSWQKCVTITRSQLTVVMWPLGALSLEPTHRQGMQRSYEMYSSRTWSFCQSNCTLVSSGHRNDKSYLFLPNYRRKQRSFARVDLCAAMFSFPSCMALDNSGRLFHDLSRYHAGHQHVQSYARKPVEMWNRLETGCPFLPKWPFKHNVLNTSCHVIDKDVDINPVSYRTENKI